WFYKAAKKGLPNAQYKMGKLFLMEQYRRIDQAIYWLDKAAIQGYAEAYVEIGNIHLQEDDDVRDVDKAVQFYKKASDLRYGSGSYKLAEIYYNKNQQNSDNSTTSNIDNQQEAIDLYKMAAEQ